MSSGGTRTYRKVLRVPSKRHPGKAFPGKLTTITRIGPGKIAPGKRFPSRPHPLSCDNSNDSGYGYDQHAEIQLHHHTTADSSEHQTQQNFNNNSNNSNHCNVFTNLTSNFSCDGIAPARNFLTSPLNNLTNPNSEQQHLSAATPNTVLSSATTNVSTPMAISLNHQPYIQHFSRAISASRLAAACSRAITRIAHKRQPITIQNSVATSSDGRVQLEIVQQPEQQHRARYQTEGSRGAIKDRSGNGFPIVRLVGYNKSAVLQIFIGTDVGRVAPHMFYQACKVTGKNSTQCYEKKIDGTVIIEIEFKPDQDMTITCDCVGILKERNVDVEHRFPDHSAQKNKKKSTRCRIVFRTQLMMDNGLMETLQVCSNPIICTQPPGVPEICKKSLNSCPVDGGLELYIIGKNFLKDTHVIFQENSEEISSTSDHLTSDGNGNVNLPSTGHWKQIVFPDKEYLQQNHLICTVPPYLHQAIMKPVTVYLGIVSSGKISELHSFIYTPKGTYSTLAAATNATNSGNTFMDNGTSVMPSSTTVNMMWPNAVEAKQEIDADMMPPPITTQMPMGVRRPSLSTLNQQTNMVTGSDQQMVHLSSLSGADSLKSELMDENAQNALSDVMVTSNSVVGCDVDIGNPQSPQGSLQYHSRYVRKPSIDTIIYDSNSVQNFPVTNSVSASTPMEVAAVAAAVEMVVKNEIAKAVSVAKVDNFITDLAQSTTVGDSTVPVSESSLFAVNNSNHMDHALTDILHQTNIPAPTASNAVTITSVLDGRTPMSGSATDPNILSGNNPPLSVELLNRPANMGLNSPVPMQQLLPTGQPTIGLGADVTAASNSNLSSDIMMNSSVSAPTILCSDNGAATAVVPNIMTPHQVTMANSILNDISMQPLSTQQDAAVAALAISNIILTPPTNDSKTEANSTAAALQADVPSATSTAVSNMIIKAAAELISTQEQQQQQHQHQQSHQQQSQMHQDVTVHQTQQQQVQGHPGQNANSQLPLNSTLNILLNQCNANVNAVGQNGVNVNGAITEVNPQFPMGIATSPQESLIVALATENPLQKSVTAAAITTNGAVVTQETPSSSTTLHSATAAAVAAATTVPLQPTIPQDITTMSDQDLISYINPSTFDQI